MPLMGSTSIILLTALYAELPCETIFFETAAQSMSTQKLKNESEQLWELAEAACETNNPDIIWQIAAVETGFQFNVVRFNRSAKVLTGKKANNYLKILSRDKRPINADFGVMQMNWYWHGKSFDNDPYKIVSPRNQVKHLVNKMVPMISHYCKKNWIGCYHNPANGKRAKYYNSAVKGARKKLEKSGLRLLTKIMRNQSRRTFSKSEMIKYYDIAHNFKHGPLFFIEKPSEIDNPGPLLGHLEKLELQHREIQRAFDIDYKSTKNIPLRTM